MAVSAEDLLSTSDVDLEELAKTLRSRADELMGRLEMVLPIYVLVTKVDLVAGFGEFCGRSHQGRSVPRPSGRELPPRRRIWRTRRRAIEQRVRSAACACCTRACSSDLSGEPLAEVRSQILQFPVEFAALRQPLARVHRGAVPGRTRTRKHRSSAASTSRAARRPDAQIDRVLDNMARGFNLPPRRAGRSQAMNAPPQSYFITELFQRVDLPGPAPGGALDEPG